MNYKIQHRIPACRQAGVTPLKTEPRKVLILQDYFEYSCINVSVSVSFEKKAFMQFVD
mgnify:CR=1 FL=1|jgi:hypothetical protein